MKRSHAGIVFTQGSKKARFPVPNFTFSRFFAIFEAVSPHFKSQNGEIRYEGADLGLPPRTKFYKNRLRGYTLLGKIYLKNITNFGDLGGLQSPF